MFLLHIHHLVVSKEFEPRDGPRMESKGRPSRGESNEQRVCVRSEWQLKQSIQERHAVSIIVVAFWEESNENCGTAA
jgi:hypothetical protein